MADTVEDMGITGLTKPQELALRQAAGENVDHLRLKKPNRWHRELTFRALVDRGLILPQSGGLTDKGRAVLAALSPPVTG